MKIIKADLDFFINAVEHNNIYNNGKWEDWQDGEEIVNIYTDNESEELKYEFSPSRKYVINMLNNFYITNK